MTIRNFVIIYVFLSLLIPVTAQAQVPELLPFQGRLTESSGNVINYTVTVNFRIYPPSGTCYIYEDTQNITPNDFGVFSTLLGIPGNSTGPANNFQTAFENDALLALPDSCATTYTPAANDWRRLEVIVNGNPLPDMQTIGASAYAFHAGTLNGLTSSEFIQVGGAVTQTNMQTLTGNVDASALHHHDSIYSRTDGSNTFTGNVNTSADFIGTGAGSQLALGHNAPAADIHVLKDAPSFRLEGTNGVGGTQLIEFFSGGAQEAAISSTEGSNEIILSTGGTNAVRVDATQNTYFLGNAFFQGAVEMGAYNNAQETTLVTSYLTPCGAACTGTIWMNSDTNKPMIWNGTASREIPTVDSSEHTNGGVATSDGTNIRILAPGANGQVLTLSGGTPTWQTPTVGTVTSVTANAPLTVTNGTTTPDLTLNYANGLLNNGGNLEVDPGTGVTVDGTGVNVTYGTTANTAVEGNDARLQDAIQIQSRDVVNTAPTDGQILKWVNANNRWEPAADDNAGGTVTNVTGTTPVSVTNGSTTPNISVADATAGSKGIMQVGSGLAVSSGTVSADVGTGATQVMGADAVPNCGAGQKLEMSLGPVFSWSCVNDNAVELQGRDVVSTAPTDGQVLTWVNANNRWEPASPTTGTVTNVTGTTPVSVTNGSTTPNISIADATAASKGIVQTGNGIAVSSGVITADPGTGVTVDGTGINVTYGTTANTAVEGNDSRLQDAIQIQSRDVVNTAPTDGQVLTWVNGNNRWEPVSPTVGTVTNVTADAPLSVTNGSTTPDLSISDATTGAKGVVQVGSGLNVASGTVSVDAGTGNNQIVQLNGTAQLPAVDGSNLTSINAVQLQSRDVDSTAPTNGQALIWNNTNTRWEPTSISGDNLGNHTATTDLSMASNNITNVADPTNAQDASTKNYADSNLVGQTLAAPTAGEDTQSLRWNNGAGNWEYYSPVSGTVTNVTGTSPVSVTNGTTTPNISVSDATTGAKGIVQIGSGLNVASGTVSVDAGTGNNQIVQLNGTAQLPAVDGSNLTSINAVQLQSRDVVSTAPTDGQVLTWVNANTRWEPVTPTTGTVTNVTANAPLSVTNGSTTPDLSISDATTGAKGVVQVGSGLNVASGTVSVDAGTGNNQIVQLNGTAQLPAVDGSNLTSINAVQIQGRDVVSTAPTDGQVLKWSNANSRWEPAADSATGDNLGNHTATTDLSMASNNITNVADPTNAQDASTKNYADGNLVGETLTAPTAGEDTQSIRWNNGAGNWEYYTPVTGTVTNVTGTSPVSVTNGTTTPNISVSDATTGAKGIVQIGSGLNVASGTVSVDAGTGNNQIVQLNGTAQLPAVDGSNLTNVNAVQLQSRDVVSTAPTDGQVLQWVNANTRWEPVTPTTGTVTNVTANAPLSVTNGSTTPDLSISDATGAAKGVVQIGNGISVAAGVITADPGTGVTVDGTGINVTYGTTANTAVEGNDSRLQNAIQLQGRDLVSTAPTDGQVLKWVNANSRWEPAADTDTNSGGTVTNVTVNAPLSVTNGTTTPDLSISDATTGAKGVVQVGSGLNVASGTVSVDAGTGNNQIVQLNGTAQLPAVDGSNLTSINAVQIQGRDVVSTAPTDGQVLKWSNANSRWEPAADSATGDNLGNHTATTDLSMASNNITNVADPTNAQDASTKNYADGNLVGETLAAPTAGEDTQSVRWNNGAGNWEYYTPNSGTVTTVTVNAPLSVTNGSTTPDLSISDATTGAKGVVQVGSGLNVASGTVSVDAGSGNNQIVQLNGTAQLPAVDGSNLTSINAVQLQGRDVVSTAPTDGQVLTWVNANSRWEPTAASSGTVTNVTGTSPVSVTNGTTTPNISVADATGASKGIMQVGSGLAVSSGTVSADIGTGAGQVMGADAVANCGTGQKLQMSVGPVYSWSCVDDNAVQLQGRDVVSTAPTDGQVLQWVNANTRWEPVTPTTGTVTTVTANAPISVTNGSTTPDLSISDATTGAKGVVQVGSGLNVASGTVSVDAGTGNNQIVQLNGTAQLPGVDGSNLTSINAVQIQGRDIVSTAPTDGQVLKWVNANSRWEPAADTDTDSGGTVTNVTANAPISVTNGTTTPDLSISDATGAAKGVVQIGNGISVAAGVITADPGTGVTVDGTGINVTYGTTANTAVEGNDSRLQNAIQLQSRDVVSTAPTDGQVLQWVNANTRWEPVTPTTGTVTTVTANAPISVTNGSTTPDLSISDATTGAKGVVQVGSGLNVASGTISVDAGTGNNQIVQLNGTAQLPAVDGSNLTSINAVQIQGRDIVSTAPTDGQVLKWVNANSRWEPAADTDTDSGGTVTNVTANAPISVTNGTTTPDLSISDATGAAKGVVQIGNGISVAAGVITADPGTGVTVDGTGINVTYGTTASTAVEGNDSRLQNAIQLQSRDVVSTAPTDGQVLQWVNANTRWEPVTPTTGTVTTVTANAPISVTNGSTTPDLSISDATGAAKGVVQIGNGISVAAGVITADPGTGVTVDGTGINVTYGTTASTAVEGNDSRLQNAIQLQSRDVVSTAPTDGQVLKWVNANSRWEPSADDNTDSTKVPLAGGTMTGALVLPANGLNVGSGQLQVTGGNVSISGNTTAAAFFYSSDKRLKTNIQNLSGLDIILALNGVSFDWIKTGEGEIGLIAQDVEQVLPELVSTDPVTGMKAVKYGNLVAPLIEATKELHGFCKATEAQMQAIAKQVQDNSRSIASNSENIETLSNKVDQLEKENQMLKNELSEIKKMIQEMKK